MRNTRTFGKTVGVGAVLAAACLVLAACGGSSDSAGGSDGDAAKPSGTPILIGAAVSKSGPQSFNGIASGGATEAWAKQVNAEGGIDGHPVEVKIVDTKNNATGAAAATKSLASDPDVDVILLTDLVAEATVADSLQAENIPVLSGGGSSNAAWNTHSNFFQPITGSAQIVGALVPLAKSNGVTNFAFAACVEAASCADGAKALSPAVDAAGMKNSGFQPINASAANYTAECLAFKNKGVDGIGMIVGADTNVRVFGDCIAQGYKGVFITPASAFDNVKFKPIDGLTVFGDMNGFPWWSTQAPAKRYVTAMKKYSPDAPFSSGSATATWMSLELMKKGLENTKPTEISRTTIFAAMHSIKDETLEGLTPAPITFTEGQPSPTLSCYWAFKYKGGDVDPTTVEPETAGNNATGDLASTCLEVPKGSEDK